VLPQTQALKLQAGGLLSINLLLLWSVVMTWLFFPLLTWMAAAPLVLLWTRPAPALVKSASILVWLCVLFMLSKEIFTIYLVITLFLAVLVYLCLTERLSLSSGLAALIVASVGVIGILWAAKAYLGYDPAGAAIKSYDAMIASVTAEVAKGKAQAWAVTFVTMARDSCVYAFRVVPGATIFYLFLTLFISNSLVTRGMLRRDPSKTRITFSFLETRLDFFFVWLLIAGWTGLFLSHELKNAVLNLFFLNSVYILAACFGLQGLAVVVTLIRRMSLPMWLWIAIAVLLLGFSPGSRSVTVILVCGIGLLDEWFHFRKIKIDIGGSE